MIGARVPTRRAVAQAGCSPLVGRPGRSKTFFNDVIAVFRAGGKAMGR